MKTRPWRSCKRWCSWLLCTGYWCASMRSANIHICCLSGLLNMWNVKLSCAEHINLSLDLLWLYYRNWINIPLCILLLYPVNHMPVCGSLFRLYVFGELVELHQGSFCLACEWSHVTRQCWSSPAECVWCLQLTSVSQRKFWGLFKH